MVKAQDSAYNHNLSFPINRWKIHWGQHYIFFCHLQYFCISLACFVRPLWGAVTVSSNHHLDREHVLWFSNKCRPTGCEWNYCTQYVTGFISCTIHTFFTFNCFSAVVLHSALQPNTIAFPSVIQRWRPVCLSNFLSMFTGICYPLLV